MREQGLDCLLIIGGSAAYGRLWFNIRYVTNMMGKAEQANYCFFPKDGDPCLVVRPGHSLAAGDFDGDGRADLAIGAPRDSGTNISDGAKPGNVLVTHGHTGGLYPVVAFEMELGLDGLPDAPEHEEEFGFALASGDFDGDGFDDLAISVPAEDDVGAVLVDYGSPFSLLFANHWYFGLIDLDEVLRVRPHVAREARRRITRLVRIRSSLDREGPAAAPRRSR